LILGHPGARFLQAIHVAFEKGTFSPESFIWFQNIPRRGDLIDDQRAAIAWQRRGQLETEARERLKLSRGRGKRYDEIITLFSKGDSNGKTRHKLAEMANVTDHKIRQVEAIADEPEQLLHWILWWFRRFEVLTSHGRDTHGDCKKLRLMRRLAFGAETYIGSRYQETRYVAAFLPA
jgi:hypothetical protein